MVNTTLSRAPVNIAHTYVYVCQNTGKPTKFNTHTIQVHIICIGISFGHAYAIK